MNTTVPKRTGTRERGADNRNSSSNEGDG